MAPSRPSPSKLSRGAAAPTMPTTATPSSHPPARSRADNLARRLANPYPLVPHTRKAHREGAVVDDTFRESKADRKMMRRSAFLGKVEEASRAVREEKTEAAAAAAEKKRRERDADKRRREARLSERLKQARARVTAPAATGSKKTTAVGELKARPGGGITKKRKPPSVRRAKNKLAAADGLVQELRSVLEEIGAESADDTSGEDGSSDEGDDGHERSSSDSEVDADNLAATLAARRKTKSARSTTLGTRARTRTRTVGLAARQRGRIARRETVQRRKVTVRRDMVAQFERGLAGMAGEAGQGNGDEGVDAGGETTAGEDGRKSNGAKHGRGNPIGAASKLAALRASIAANMEQAPAFTGGAVKAR